MEKENIFPQVDSLELDIRWQSIYVERMDGMVFLLSFLIFSGFILRAFNHL